jgi:type VI secretion system secreted protein Hcp
MIDNAQSEWLQYQPDSSAQGGPGHQGGLAMSKSFYMSIKGTKQGQFKGQSTKSSRGDKWIECVSFEMTSEIPVDLKTGQPAGKRTHSPIVITKQIDSASPQLLNAHSNSEVLDPIVIELVGRPSSGAGEVVIRRITLTGARVANVRNFVGKVRDFGGPGHLSQQVLQEFGFVFNKIAVENPASSTPIDDLAQAG